VFAAAEGPARTRAGFRDRRGHGIGTDALTALDQKPVDVLLLDISIPVLPGPRVAEAALRKLPRLGIVVLTMHEDDITCKSCFGSACGVRAEEVQRPGIGACINAVRAKAMSIRRWRTT